MQQGIAGSRRGLVESAIRLAVDGLWAEAEATNLELIRSYGPDPEAWNRIGKARLELGRREEARDAYRAALELDAANAIATRNLLRLDGSAAPQGGETRFVPGPADDADVPPAWIERGIAETDLDEYLTPYSEYEEEPGAEAEPIVPPFDEAEVETVEEMGAEAEIKVGEREQSRRERWLAEEEELPPGER